MAKKQNKEAISGKSTLQKGDPSTTGHEWDGIREFNNPLPRWWLWSFIACIVCAVGYALWYPSLPHFFGISGWSQYGKLEKELATAAENQRPFEEKIATLAPREILQDESLRSYAISAGRATFALHCSQCHGAGGGGAKGFPSLLDDEWLWGGKLEDIIQTITHGIRDETDYDTRMSAMSAFGRDEILTPEEIEDVARYVMYISGQIKPSESSERGAEIFTYNCATCHGEDATGGREFGAPNLTNGIWLYGGDRETILETIHGGRSGVMPAFGGKLDENLIKKVAIYVYSLSGGE